jgi:hypothetical protein
MGDRRKVARHSEESDPARVVPFGLRGVGLLTGHPIGLGIVFGVLLIGLIGIPEARLFFAASMVLGTVFGLLFWLHHR